MVLVYSVYIFHIQIPSCRSLKEKRSCINPLILKIQKKYNVSVAEIDKQDAWSESIIACSLISNDRRFSEGYLAGIHNFVKNSSKDFYIIDHSIQFL